MTKEQLDTIINDQKSLKDLPNKTLVNHLDIISTEHEFVKETIIKNTMYLDKLEELYNNVLKVYQDRTNG